MLAKIPFGLGDSLGSAIRKIVVGDLSKYGISTPKLSPTKQLKVTGRTPVVDNKDGLPSQAVFDSTHEGLYFVGFNNYVPGGALGVINSESEEVVNHLIGKS